MVVGRDKIMTMLPQKPFVQKECSFWDRTPLKLQHWAEMLSEKLIFGKKLVKRNSDCLALDCILKDDKVKGMLADTSITLMIPSAIS